MDPIESKMFSELRVGDAASLSRALTVDDMKRAAAVLGDTDASCEQTDTVCHGAVQQMFAHGGWLAALVAAVLDTQLPGPGTEWIDQTVRFLAPSQVGDTVTVTVRVTEKMEATERVTMAWRCVNQAGVAVAEGEVTIRAPREKTRWRSLARPGGGHVEQGARLRALIARARPREPMVTAVVHPVDDASIGGAVEAARQGLITPILVGPEAKIRAAAETAQADIGGLRIVSTEHSHEAGERAVALVRAGEAEALMKGALHTDELMHPVVAKEGGLRTSRQMSHVFVIDEPSYPRLMLLTDAAINIDPDLESKRDIVQNAIDLAQALGIDTPKVGILSAVETVTPKLRSTWEAAALCKMADRGQITGGVLDGPLAFDNAVSKAAAQAKHIRSAVAGEADVLLVPDLEAGNMLAKQLEYLAGAKIAGVVLGARVPIMLTSRADTGLARLASCAVAVLFHQWQQEQGSRP